MEWTQAALGDDDDETTPEGDERVDLATTVAAWKSEGYSAEDVADRVRIGGATIGALLTAMKSAGYSNLVVKRAIKHFSADCPHEGGGDIGTLPILPDSRMPLDGTEKDIRDVAGDSWAAIAKANSPEQFLTFGGLPAWINANPREQAVVEEITLERMLYLLGEVGYWERDTREGKKECRPPRQVAAHMVADPHSPLPRLRRLALTPVFDSQGGLVIRPGYHAASELFLATRDLNVPPVMHAPTRREVERALSLVVDDLLGDFPFVDDSDRTNAVVLLLLPFVRDLIAGPTPLHLMTKPYPGSGGTLLVQALLYPALGERAPTLSVPTSQIEWEYKMTSILMTGPTAIVFDNVRKLLDSDQLASALTGAVWLGRQIKTSNMPRCLITNAWVATGNNVKVSDEIARRTLPIRLDPHTDRPFDRTGFRHPDLIGWMHEMRNDLIWAALTLVQAWIAEGMPYGTLVVGMYEGWAGVMSGIAQVVGLPDLRGNWREWNEGQPSDVNLLRKVFRAWSIEFGDRKVKAKDLLPVIGRILDIDPDGDLSSLTTLGMRLRNWHGRIVDNLEMVGQDVSGSMSWRLIRRESEALVLPFSLAANEQLDQQKNE